MPRGSTVLNLDPMALRFDFFDNMKMYLRIYDWLYQADVNCFITINKFLMIELTA